MLAGKGKRIRVAEVKKELASLNQVTRLCAPCVRVVSRTLPLLFVCCVLLRAACLLRSACRHVHDSYPCLCARVLQGDVFLLDMGLELIRWDGAGANIFEKRRVARHVHVDPCILDVRIVSPAYTLTDNCAFTLRTSSVQHRHPHRIICVSHARERKQECARGGKGACKTETDTGRSRANVRVRVLRRWL